MFKPLLILKTLKLSLGLAMSCKKYFIKDQQISRHFVQFSECLYRSLPFLAIQTINLTSRISANHDKGFGF